MDNEERVLVVRRANELYNAGDIEGAKNLYLKVNYTAGIIRVADYYYEQRKPILAMLLYRRAGCSERVDELYKHAAGVIRQLLAEDARERQAFSASEDALE
jgi:hypothetical protein